jgi:hypothetical protein
MTHQIHRKEVIDPDKPFKAPKNVTFGWQNARQEFSVWYLDTDAHDTEYIIVGTGHPFLGGKLRQSFVMPDGFQVYHLIEV